MHGTGKPRSAAVPVESPPEPDHDDLADEIPAADELLDQAITKIPPPNIPPPPPHRSEHFLAAHARIASEHEAFGSLALMSGHTSCAHSEILLILQARQSLPPPPPPPGGRIWNITVMLSSTVITPRLCRPTATRSTG